jgi:hypothetical protein
VVQSDNATELYVPREKALEASGHRHTSTGRRSHARTATAHRRRTWGARPRTAAGRRAPPATQYRRGSRRAAARSGGRSRTGLAVGHDVILLQAALFHSGLSILV